ncbi:MAG: SpoIVB peptidase S55 domain-containing protein [Bacillota bacterium]
MRKRKYLIIIMVVLLFFSAKSSAAEIMSLDKIHSGMEGSGYTVFQGTKVESFPVDIINIMENQGLNEELILVRTSGEKMEEIGGIAAGMSGSPVYVDNKIIGAIAYSWSNGSGLYALVTPIERMLDLLPEKSSGDEQLTSKDENNNSTINISENLAKVNAPLMVSGMNGRALDRLKEDMSDFDLRVVPGGEQKPRSQSSRKIKPGSAIAVQLVKGDINVSSIGTVTYINGNDILAFGHSFTNRGNVNFLLSEAYINATIPNDEQPFKLGSTIDRSLGIINNDRNAGVSGELREYPDIIPVKIQVDDKTRDKTELIEVQIVRDERLFTSLTTDIALQSIDSVIDRIGEGTATVDFSVMGSGLPDFEVSRKNTFYSNSDIAGRSLADLYQILQLITTNPYKKVDIMSVNVDVDVSKKENVAFLKEVKILNKHVYPGDKVDIEATIQPYRKKEFKKIFSLELPEDIDPGMSNIIVSGGFTGESYQGSGFNEDDFSSENGEMKKNSIQGYKNLSEMIDAYLSTPKNNEIIVQFYPGYAPPPMPEGETQENKEEDNFEDGDEEDLPAENREEKAIEEEQTEEESSEAEIKELYSTDYVLEGSLSLNLEIEKESSEDDKAEQKSEKQSDSEESSIEEE